MLGERSPDMMAALSRLDAARQLTLTADPGAAKWYGFQAEDAARRHRYQDSVNSFLAAIQADPANPRYLTGLAYSNYHLGNMAALKSLLPVLPVLAPKSSNTWYLAALGWAADSTHDPVLAVAAFHLAYTVSGDRKVTRALLQAESGRASDARVRSALSAALREIDGGTLQRLAPVADASAPAMQATPRQSARPDSMPCCAAQRAVPGPIWTGKSGPA